LAVREFSNGRVVLAASFHRQGEHVSRGEKLI